VTEARDLKIVFNGEEREIEEGATVALLVRQLALAPERVAVELNREVVRRARWDETKLSAGDRVEVVHFVGGGAQGRRWPRGFYGPNRPLQGRRF
jgi:thiamine biosynthesis protein ThiS